MKNGQPHEVWFIFESDHKDLQEAHEALVRDGRIFGNRLNTTPNGPNRRVIDTVIEVSLDSASVVVMMDMVDDLYDAEGNALFLLSDEEAR